MIQFRISKDFERQFKRLYKKYRTLPEDLSALSNQLALTPLSGIDLGDNVRKIRMAVRAKGKGKSHGLRVIAHVNVIVEAIDGVITYLYIYDKSEIANISDEKVAELLKDLLSNH